MPTKLEIQQNVFLLRRAAVFTDVPREALEMLGRAALETIVQRGQAIFAKGTPAEAFYVIREGFVRIEKDGQELARLGPGAIFGEMGALDAKPRGADAIAETSVSLMEVPRTAFLAMLASQPALEVKIRCKIVARHHENVSTAFSDDD